MKPQKRILAVPAAQRKAARTESTRMALFEAAGRVIGRYGYVGCSIARVTAKAKIAHGTFYLYFSSQQELFSEIRVALGQKMLSEIFRSIGSVGSIRELEAQYVAGTLAYFKKYPYMFKVMATSERAGAARDRDFMRAQVDLYVGKLRTIMGPDFSDDYLKALTVMIAGVRSNTLQIYGLKDDVVLPPPDAAIEFYLNFIAAGAASPANLMSPDWNLGGAPSALDVAPSPPPAEVGADPADAPPARPVARRRLGVHSSTV